MTHPNNEIRCPYCGAREARVNAEVTAAMVTNVIDAIALPAVPGTIYVSENAEAHCAACENYSSFGAWQGMAGHMPADVPESAEPLEAMRGPVVTEVLEVLRDALDEGPTAEQMPRPSTNLTADEVRAAEDDKRGILERVTDTFNAPPPTS